MLARSRILRIERTAAIHERPLVLGEVASMQLGSHRLHNIEHAPPLLTRSPARVMVLARQRQPGAQGLEVRTLQEEIVRGGQDVRRLHLELASDPELAQTHVEEAAAAGLRRRRGCAAVEGRHAEHLERGPAARNVHERRGGEVRVGCGGGGLEEARSEGAEPGPVLRERTHVRVSATYGRGAEQPELLEALERGERGEQGGHRYRRHRRLGASVSGDDLYARAGDFDIAVQGQRTQVFEDGRQTEVCDPCEELRAAFDGAEVGREPAETGAVERREDRRGASLTLLHVVYVQLLEMLEARQTRRPESFPSPPEHVYAGQGRHARKGLHDALDVDAGVVEGTCDIQHTQVRVLREWSERKGVRQSIQHQVLDVGCLADDLIQEHPICVVPPTRRVAVPYSIVFWFCHVVVACLDTQPTELGRYEGEHPGVAEG